MTFILLFIAGGLVLPVMIDSKKNPKNNIFKRAYNDIKKSINKP